MGDEESAEIEIGHCPLSVFLMVSTTTSVMAHFSHIASSILGVYKVMPWKLSGKGVAVGCAVVAFGLLSQASDVSGARKLGLYLWRTTGGVLCVHHGQLRVDLVQQIPQSYRSLYPHLLVQYIDVANG